MSAVADIGGGRWNAFDGEDGSVFVLSSGSSTEWPATLSITAVTDDKWVSVGALVLDDRDGQPSHDQPGHDQPSHDQPGHDQTGADQPGDGRVPLAHRVCPGHAVASFDVGIEATLPGSPIRAEMLIDLSPRLHLVGAAAGRDIYELSRLIDSIAVLLSEVPAGTELAQLGMPQSAGDGV